MQQLLIAFAGEKTRKHIQEIFDSIGIKPAVVCGSGAEILRQCAQFTGGVVLCGYKLYDMMADELYEDLPEGYAMALLAAQPQLDACNHQEICKLSAPARRSELVGTVKMLLGVQEEPASVPKRSEEDRWLIDQAKELLMNRNQMTENQAHRFLQKRSMDSGEKMVQTAARVLDGQLLI